MVLNVVKKLVLSTCRSNVYLIECWTGLKRLIIDTYKAGGEVKKC